MFRTLSTLLAAAAISITAPALAQDADSNLVEKMFGSITRSSGLTGEMTVTMPSDSERPDLTEVLRFEPWQMLDDLFRDDIVFLMRHGPTDWSMRDITNVAPDDCDNQRIMTEAGKRQMRELGTLMVTNEVVPGRIIVSQWCRNQETLAALREGMLDADPAALDGVPVETFAELNLLLSLQGAPNVTAMRQMISDWDGSDATGPLLVISHYTNIEELTEFNVYEGEMLVVDPKRENRVLGYLRLRSATPDVGHFTPEVVEAATAAAGTPPAN